MSINYRALGLSALLMSTPLLLNSAEPASAVQTAAWQDELNTIETEIQALKLDLQTYRKKSLNEEMQAQPLMIDNWHEYADRITLSEDDEKRVLVIKARMAALNTRKQEILKNHPAP